MKTATLRTSWHSCASGRACRLAIRCRARRKREARSDASSNERFHATIDFYMDVERRYFEEMKTFLREELDLTSLLFGTSDWPESPIYPSIRSNSMLDFIGGHIYWQHPNSPGVVNTPMVDAPGASTFMNLSRSAVAGMPYAVPETNHPSPNFYESEGIPILAAYGSFQDWSGILIYTFEPKGSREQEPFIGDAFDISHHPVKMPQMALPGR